MEKFPVFIVYSPTQDFPRYYYVIYEPRRQKNRSSGFPTRSDTNRAVLPLQRARGLKFSIKKAEGLYYPSGENKGADQLCGHRKADLRLCFRICKIPVFSRRGSYLNGNVSVMTTKL